MKKVIAATVFALSAAAHAAPFDFERQIGAEALFSSVGANEYSAPSSTSISSPVFAHERNFGDVALYPTLIREDMESSINTGTRSSEPFNYWVQIWNTDVEIGG